MQELEAFDRDFAPDGGRRPGVDSLADGDYDFEIVHAELTKTEKTNEAILKLDLRVAGEGAAGVVRYAYLFRSLTGVNVLGSDLCTLGFDADQWKPPARPLSRELPRAVPLLPGIRFRGKKKTTPNPKDPTKPYANLYVNQKLDGSGPPPAYAPEGATSSPPVADNDPIPF